MAQCRACPAQIFWATQNPTDKNPKPRANPLDVQPSPEGNLRLDLSTMLYDVLTGEALEEARKANEPLYISHFATCPNRGQFRQSRKAPARK